MVPTRSLAAWLPWAVLLLGLVAEAQVETAKPGGFTSVVGTALIAHLEYPGDVHVKTLTLRLANGSVVNTQGADEHLLHQFYTGQKVNVTGVLSIDPDPRVPPTLAVDSITALETQPRTRANVTVVDQPHLRVNGLTASAGGGAFRLPVTLHEPLYRSFRVLIIPLYAKDDWGNVCPGVTTGMYEPQDLRNALWGSKEYNLVGMYDDCSNGRTRLDAAGSRVADWVEISCSGYSAFGPWSMPGCGDNDARGWMEHADGVMRQRGENYANYDFVTYLAPPSSTTCAWLAVAETGCAGSSGYQCKMWAHGWGWDSVAMYLHEYGHHIFLGHSSQRDANGVLQGYGDGSSTMGLCCNVRCYNTPHAFQIGWLPVVEIDGSSLEAGSTISMVLQPQMRDRGVRVTPTWAEGSMPFFLGYRDLQGYDKDLKEFETSYAERTNVYRSNVVDPRSIGTTEWVAGLNGAFTSYSDSITGLTFRHEGKDGAGVRISICRYGGPETLDSCCYGRDQDCNGLGGKEDPACEPFLSQCSGGFKFGWNLGTTNPNPGVPSKVDTAISKAARRAESVRKRMADAPVPAPST